MERDDGKSAAGIQVVNGRAHHAADRTELVVDGNADGLKAPLGGVLLFPKRPLGHGGFDDVHQLQRRLDRPVRAHALNRRRDLRGVPLLAVFVQDSPELVLGIVIDDLIGRQAAASVHAHIKRRVRHIRKAARAVVQLWGRNAQVKEHTVDFVEIQRIQNQRNVFKIIMHQRHLARVTAEPLFCRFQRDLVAVDTNEPAVCQSAANLQ